MKALKIKLEGLTDEEREEALKVARCCVDSPVTIEGYSAGDLIGVSEGEFVVSKWQWASPYCQLEDVPVPEDSITLPLDTIKFSYGVAIEYKMKATLGNDRGGACYDFNIPLGVTAFIHDLNCGEEDIKAELDLDWASKQKGISIVEVEG